VTLLCLTDPELWSYWHHLGDASLREHVRCLRERYDVALTA
jgi:hypothetical protein